MISDLPELLRRIDTWDGWSDGAGGTREDFIHHLTGKYPSTVEESYGFGKNLANTLEAAK